MEYPKISSPAGASTVAERSFWVVVPPPPLFIVPFIASLRLGRLLPFDFGAAESPARVVGIALIVAALGLLGLAPALFAWRRTTIVPHRSSQSLVTDGPYRITRNPMYLGLTLLYVGASLFANSVWPLVALGLPLWVMQSKTIPFEEANLERVFGDSYRSYCQRVRRWI